MELKVKIPIPPFTALVIDIWLDVVNGEDREKLKSVSEARSSFLDSLAEDSRLKDFPLSKEESKEDL